MTDTTTRQTAEPLQLLESGIAGYCDPLTGMCVLPAAVPESHGDPETTTGHEETAVVPEFRPIGD